MTFLAPVAGLIGAAVGVPLLVMLYLLKLRRKPLKVSSTLLWEQTVHDLQANVPLRWLRWSWLLLLQLAALACLLLALARPAVPGTSEIGTRTIFVIDRSASMAASDGVRASVPATSARFSRLDQAKREARNLIEQMRRGSGARPQAMVIAMGAEAMVVQPFTSDTRALRDAINSIELTDQPADLASVVQIAGAASLAGTDTESAPARTALVLFSDGAIEPCRERLPRSVDLRLVRVGPKTDPAGVGATPGNASPPLPLMPDNLGIVAIGARRDAENPAVVRLFVRVTNAGPKEIATTLGCRVDGEAAGLLPLTVPGAVIGSDGTCTPGEAAGTLELDRPAGGLAVVNIARPDLLDADNAAAVVLSPVSKPRILVVGRNDPADPYAAARGPLGIDRFLLGVLQDLDPAELRTIDLRVYRDEVRAAAPGDAGVARYDLIIFDRVRPDELPPVPTISIGAGLQMPGIDIDPGNSTATRSTRFISWKRSHPVLRSAALDSVLIAPPMRMRIDEEAAGAPNKADITPLAFGIDGPLIALAQEPGVRGVKRLVLAFDLVRTNWGKEVSFPVFVSSAVDYLTGRGETSAGRSFATGQGVSVLPSSGIARLIVSGPEDFAVEVPGSSTAGPSEVSIGLPRLAGVYTIDGTVAADRRIVVNLVNPRESALGVASSIEIGGQLSRSGSDRMGGEPPRREVWHWFILIAGGLLTVEWFIYAWRAKA